MVDRHTLSLDCHLVSHCFSYENDSVTVCDSIYIYMGKNRHIGENDTCTRKTPAYMEIAVTTDTLLAEKRHKAFRINDLNQ